MKFAVPGFDVVSDFFGHLDGVKIAVPGSHWFIVPSIISHFASEGIDTYFESLPEVLVRRRANGSPITLGNLVINNTPEIVCLENGLIREMKTKDQFEAFEDSVCVAYMGNRTQPDICEIKNPKLAIPNPRNSSLGLAFKKYYEKNCGYYGDLKGNAAICDVHHREIPEKIINGQVDYGILWKSEALYWKFKHYFPETLTRRFSWLLMDNAGLPSKDVFNMIRSGVLNDYYKKYGYNIISK
jgi:hypothetical protein